MPSQHQADYFIERLIDPDQVGQSEYRVIHQLLIDAVASYAQDWDGDLKSLRTFMYGVLDEVTGAAKGMRWRIASVRIPMQDTGPATRTFQIVMADGERQTYQATDAVDAAQQHKRQHPGDRPQDIQLIRL